MPWWVWLLSAKLVVGVLLVALVGVAVVGMFAGGASFGQQYRQRQAAQVLPVAVGVTGDGSWDAGNIIADSVFYNAGAMTAPQIQAFLDGQGCVSVGCLGVGTYSWPGASVAWCRPVAAGSGSFAVMLATVSTACGINPQVGLVMIAKESQGLTRNPPPAALTGFGCPDTGPGGGPNCDSGPAGAWAQTWGMVQAFAHLHQDPSKVNYLEGQTHDILWNVADTGCGSAPVLVRNRATATLYTYTPYQPDAAGLASYPGTGDACSAYGNRNFYRLFTTWFGSTGGGKPLAAAPGVVNVALNGVAVTVPDNQYVVPALRGKVITAPDAGIAKGLAAGFGTLGTLYVWGGGFGPGGAATDGCARGGGALNSCQGQIGWDCSGLTNYVLVQGGFPSPGGESDTQRSTGTAIPWAAGLPGDIVGFPGHVALYLGNIGGQDYLLEASDVGLPNQVVPLTRTDHDPVLHRHWS